MKKLILIIVIFNLLAGILMIAEPAFAYNFGDIKKFYTNTAQTSGFETEKEPTVADYVATIINALLALVGVVFVILIIYSGSSWMMSAGNPDKVGKAKKTLVYSIVGLFVVFASYSITLFVSNWVGGTTPTSTAGSGSGDTSACPGTCIATYNECLDLGGEVSDPNSPAGLSCGSGVCCKNL